MTAISLAALWLAPLGPAAGTTLVSNGFNTATCPVGWATEIVTNAGGSPAITFVTSSTEPNATPYEGSRFVKFNYCLSGNKIRLKQTNGFSTVGADAPVSVRFAWHQDLGFPNSTNEGATVQWSTNGTAWTSGTFFPRYISTSNGWRRMGYTLPAGAVGQPVVYLAFLFHSQYGNNCYLDDLSVTDITDVIPNEGPTAGGTVVYLARPGLGNGTDITNVTVCGITAAIQSQTTGSVTVVTAPAAFGAGNVVIRSTSLGTTVFTNSFTYWPPGAICGDFIGWTNAIPLPAPRAFCGAAATDGNVYLAGGSTNLTDSVSTVYRLNTKLTSSSWVAVSNLPAPRRALAMASVGRYLFALGGENNSLVTNTVYRYDTTLPSQGWTSVSNLPAPRKYLSATVAQGKLYAIGGANASSVAQSSVYMYDPLQPNQGWSTVSNLPAARQGLAATSFGGRIYALGGTDSIGTYQATVYAFDPFQPALGWTSISNLPAPRYGLAAASQDGRLYTLGGRYSVWEKDIYAYDPVTPSEGWAFSGNLPTGSIMHAAAALDTGIVAAGGWDGYHALTGVVQSCYSPGITPDFGVLAGGETVVIRGVNLGRGDVTNVSLCGVNAIILSDASPTQITVQAGSSLLPTNGMVAVYSRSHGLTVASNAYAYVLAAPIVLAPTNVTLNGFWANWTSVPGVTNYRADVALDEAFTSHLPGYQDLRLGNVSTLFVTGVTAGATCRYRLRSEYLGTISTNSAVATAYIPGLSVTNGPGRGGNLLTINRAELGNGDDITRVTLCGMTAVIVSQSADSVTVLVPGTYVGTGDVQVYSASHGLNVFTNGYTYVSPGYIHGALHGWDSVSGLSTGRTWLATTAAAGNVYAIGGFTLSGGGLWPSATVEVYNPSQSAAGWSSISNLPAPRAYLAAASAGDRIYAMGGTDTMFIRTNVFVYDTTQPARGWTNGVGLPVARAAAAAAEVNGLIYLIGGEDEHGDVVNTVFRFDPSQPDAGWTNIASLPQPRRMGAAVALHGRLYAIGGEDTLWPQTDVYCYDPARPAQGWQSVSNLPIAIEAPAAAPLNGRIYVFGGWTNGASAAAWCYDPLKPAEGWQSVAKLPAARSSPGAIALDGRIYVLGGDDGTTPRTNVYVSTFEPAAVSPNRGARAGGETVTIRGSGLCSGTDVTQVALCGLPATLLSSSPTQVVVSTAYALHAGLGNVDVVSATAGDTVASNAFGYRPFTPTVLSASNVTVNSFFARWKAVSEATGYRLDVSRNADFTEPVAGYDDRPVDSGTSYRVWGLLAGTAYYYRVRAETGGVASLNSGTAAVTVAAGSISVPVGPASGGNVLLLTGTGMGSGSDIVRVTVCGVPAVILSQSTSNVLVRVVSGGEGRGDIVVESTSLGPTRFVNAYTYLAPGVIGGETLTWSSVSNLPVARVEHAAAGVSNTCYVIGGSINYNETATVLQYDRAQPNSGWTLAASLPVSRARLAAAVAGGKMYAIGGLSSYSPTAAVTCYDPAQPARGWTNAPGLPVPRYGLAAAAVAGRLYALGGRDGSNTVQSTVFRYDPAEPTQGWITVSSLPAPRSDLAAASYDGKLYAIGGVDSHFYAFDTVFVYDPSMPEFGWTSVTNLPAVRHLLGAAAYAGRLHILGGRDYTSNLSSRSVFALDPSRPSSGWVSPGDLPSGREGLAVACAGGRLFAVGGQEKGYTDLANPTATAWEGSYAGGVTPAEGSLAGGNTVTIRGLNLGSGSDITNVTLCGIQVTDILSQSATQVVVTAAAGISAGRGSVAVYSTSRGETVATAAYGYRPVAPTPLPASNIGSGGFDANWVFVPGVSSNYILDVSTTADFSSFVSGFESLRVGMSIGYPVRGLRAGVTYWYRVGYEMYDGLQSERSTGVAAQASPITLSTTNGPASGGNTLTIWGSMLSGGTPNDITNVTVCGQMADLVSHTMTSVTVRVSASTLPGVGEGCGDVIIYSSTRGSTTLPNSYTYGVRGHICGRFRYWESLSNLPAPRADALATWRYGQAMVMGGTDGTSAKSDVWGIDPNNVVTGWSANFALPAPRARAAIGGCGNSELVIGGIDLDGATSDSVFLCNRFSGTWTLQASLPAPRAGLAAVGVNSKIYAIGGRDAAGQPQSAVFLYDTARPADGWTTISNLPAPRAELAAAAVDGRIFALGGTDGTSARDTVFRYDPASAVQGWTVVASLPTGLVSLACGASAGRIYATGGMDSSSNAHFATYLYDPQNDERGWLASTNLPLARARQASSGGDNGILLAGGYDGEAARAEALIGTFDKGVTPDSGRWAGDEIVVIDGVGLGAGDVTNVTICGVKATLMTDLSPTQIVVRTVSVTNSLRGDVIVESASCGTTIRFDAFAYSLEAPAELTVSDIGVNGFNVSWQSVTNADAYWIEVSTTNNFITRVPGFAPLLVAETSRLLTGLLPSTTYYCRVRAVQNQVEGLPSAVITAATTACIVNPGTGPQAGGRTITISGTGMGNGSDITNVTVCGVTAAILSQMPYAVTVRTGPGIPGVGDIIVRSTSRGVTYLALAFKYNPPGRISGDLFWTSAAALPSNRVLLSLAAANGNVYAFGGMYSQASAQAWRYDPSQPTQGWLSISNLPEPRISPSGAAAGGKVYAVGGHEGSGNTSASVYCYDPANPGSGWTATASLPQARSLLAVTPVSNKLYALGGYTYSGDPYPHENVDCFDPVNPEAGWIADLPLPFGLESLAATTQDGAIYAVGGHAVTGPVNTAFSYTPGQPGAQWTALASLPDVREGLATASLEGRILAVGGYDGTDSCSSVYLYDPFQPSRGWLEATRLPEPIPRAAAASVGDKLFVTGTGTNVYRGAFTTGVSPASGPLAGGTVVTIRGDFLCDGNDVTNVTLCGQTVTSILAQSPTQVVVVASSASGAVTGGVTVCSRSFGITTRSNAYAYVFMPRILATAGYGGAITPSGHVYVAYGATIPFAVTSDPFYHIKTILTNGIPAGFAGATNVILTWPSIVSDGNIAASFAANLATNRVPEWWLHRYYPTAPNFQTAALSDTDADGMPAWGEYHAHTDPTNRLSVLALATIARAGAECVVSWQSATGCLYRLFSSTNVQTGFDLLWKSGIPATPPLNVETDKTDVIGPSRFYRVDLEIPPEEP